MGENYTVGNLIYDGAIYDGMNTDLGDLEFYQKWMPKKKDTRILELCCGTGRLTIPLAKAGYAISGVDYTPSMLEHAKAKAAKEGLDITFIEADMRTLDLPDTYDLIFIPFNSIHHLYTNDDLFKTLQAVKKHLKEDGLFLFDCFNPNLRFLVDSEHQKKQIAAYTTEDGREIVVEENMHYESDSQINRITWHYFIDGKFDSVQNVDMRLFYPQELDTYLEWNGFTVLHKFGGFSEEPFTETSEKQLFVCR